MLNHLSMLNHPKLLGDRVMEKTPSQLDKWHGPSSLRLGLIFWAHPYCGWLRNPAPVDKYAIIYRAEKPSNIGDAGFLPPYIVLYLSRAWIWYFKPPHTWHICISVNVVKLINHPTNHDWGSLFTIQIGHPRICALLGMVYYWATLVVRIIYIYIHINIHIRLYKYKSISITV